MKKYKELIGILLLTISFLFFISRISIRMEEVYFIGVVFYGFIKSLGFLIIPLSKYVEIDRRYIYLILYLATSGILVLMICILLIIDSKIYYEEMEMLGFLHNIMLITAFVAAMRAKEKNSKVIVANVFFNIGVIIFIASMILLLPQLNFISEYIFFMRSGLKLLKIILLVALAIVFNQYCLKKSDIIIKRDLLKYLIVCVVFNLIALFEGRLIWVSDIKIPLIFMCSYYIAKVFFICLIQKPNESFYSRLNSKNNKLKITLGELESYSRIIEQDNQHINNILESFPEAVVMVENDIIIFANTRFKEIFQCYDNKKIIGINIAEIVRDDYYEQLMARGEDLKRSGHCNEIEYEFKLYGKAFTGEMISTNIKRGNRQIVISVIRDVTRKKLIESLNRTIECNEKDNRMRSELLANISHEFKTPVNVIYSAIQMQDLYANHKDIKNIMKFNNSIKQNCFRLLRLINNFIDISKFEADTEIHSNMKPINIVTLVEDVVTSVISYGNKNNISITFDTDNEEIYGEFDVEMMDRIMLNLLSNAIKYNVDGGEIFVEVSETQDNISISVKDTGVGIEPENVVKLFHRFERLDKSLSRKREGSGIGLNIVKSLVEHQRGTIEVTSELNKGTIFLLKFPKCQVDFYDIDFNEMPKANLINKVSLELSDII